MAWMAGNVPYGWRGRVTGRGRRSLLGFAVVGFTLFGMTEMAWAGATERAKQRATSAVSEVEQAAGRITSTPRKVSRHDTAHMIASGDLFYRTKQYGEAIDELSKVVELHRQGRASSSVNADAHFLLGQAYFATGELYSARLHFEEITEHSDDAAYEPLAGPAASRLVDIALQIQRPETLPEVLARVDRMLARGTSDALLYARAKALFAMGNYDQARAETEKINGSSIYAQRAAYLRGTSLMKSAQAKVPPGKKDAIPDFKEAIVAFEQATVPATDEGDNIGDAAKITDLAWLAIGRLHYEAKHDIRSIRAYEKISRTSPYFPEALFELAWAYVRLGDYQRGQRALESLSVLAPGLIDGSDAALLRGDLLLRSGKFKEAQEAYEQVRKDYDPLRDQVARFIAANEDSAVYYDKLTASDIEIGQELPALAIDWAREEAQEERVFAIVDDVARSRSLIKRSRKIITLLRAALGSESRAKVFPELEAQLVQVEALLNQLAIARLSLARGMDSVASSGSGQLRSTRSARRRLMPRLGTIPTNPGDFSVRADRTDRQWDKVSQELQRLQLEADHLRALVNGLNRMVHEAERHGLSADDATIERFKTEISENEKDLAVYLRRIEELRDEVEMGRVQSGLGDERFEDDERVRSEFARLFEEEVNLATKVGDKEAQYATSVRPILARISAVEGRLFQMKKQLNQQTMVSAEEVQAVVEEEAQAIEIYASRLDTMDQHARVLVGEVAKANLLKVRDRIKDVVMRADIGLVQQAWEVREEQRYRVRDLLRERAQEERLINDELREVLDDASEGER